MGRRLVESVIEAISRKNTRRRRDEMGKCALQRHPRLWIFSLTFKNLVNRNKAKGEQVLGVKDFSGSAESGSVQYGSGLWTCIGFAHREI